MQLESGVRYVRRRHSLASEPRVGSFPARQRRLRPCPTSRPQHPRRLELQVSSTPLRILKTSFRNRKGRPWSFCPRPRKESSGTWPAGGGAGSALSGPIDGRCPSFSSASSSSSAFPTEALTAQRESGPGPRSGLGADSLSWVLCWRPAPQRQLPAGLRAPSRGGREAAGLPFNGSYALSAPPQRVWPWPACAGRGGGGAGLGRRKGREWRVGA